MKTQKNHRERQLLHSFEVMKHRANTRLRIEETKYKHIGWMLPVVWGTITLVFYFFG